MEVDLFKLDSAACFAILAEPFSKGPPSQVGSAASRVASAGLQWLVNDAPELLDQQIGLGRIDRRSPRRAGD